MKAAIKIIDIILEKTELKASQYARSLFPNL